MADLKGKKPGGGDGEVLKGPFQTKNVWEFLIVAVFIIAIAIFLVAHFLGFLNTISYSDSKFFVALRGFYQWFKTIIPYLKILSFLFCIVLLYLTILIYRRFLKVRKKEAEKYAPPKNMVADDAVGAGTFTQNPNNKRWTRVLEHVESKSPNDWKIAIIEADSILDDMTKSMGYHGDTLGERLKAVEVSDFNTLNNAWDAHKVRNQIAHEGSNFQLNERETRRVIALYESVFKEFKYI